MSSSREPGHRGAGIRGREAGRAPSVVLVRPREEGNVGAVARAMANMGLDELILVEPAPELGGRARGFGVGGWHVLDRAARCPSLERALASFHRAVGTTSARGRTLARSRVIDARDLAAELLPDAGSAAARVALVFGPEDSGLRRDELALCDPIAVIPCAPHHPTLNLSQAVLLLAYELFRTGPPADPVSASAGPAGTAGPGQAPPASLEEMGILLERSAPLVERLGFDHGHIHRSVLRDLALLLHRASPNRREAGLLRRLVERCRERLGIAEPGDDDPDPLRRGGGLPGGSEGGAR